MKKNKFSKNWIIKQKRDIYVRQSKLEGYRSRAVYKLIEINEKFKILKKGSLVVDLGYHKNDLSGSTNTAKIMFVYPPRDRASASTNFIGETAFSDEDMSSELLSKVRRTNKQVIESEGSGVVMAKTN